MKCSILKHSIVKRWHIHFAVFAEPKGVRARIHFGWIILGRRMQD
jgi:hypothetical protein